MMYVGYVAKFDWGGISTLIFKIKQFSLTKRITTVKKDANRKNIRLN